MSNKSKTPLQVAAEKCDFSQIYRLISVPQISLLDAMKMLSLDLRGIYHDTGHEALDTISSMFLNLVDALDEDGGIPLDIAIKRVEQILDRMKRLRDELD